MEIDIKYLPVDINKIINSYYNDNLYCDKCTELCPKISTKKVFNVLCKDCDRRICQKCIYLNKLPYKNGYFRCEECFVRPITIEECNAMKLSNQIRLLRNRFRRCLKCKKYITNGEKEIHNKCY